MQTKNILTIKDVETQEKENKKTWMTWNRDNN